MDLERLRSFILFSKPLYFGWLLSVPYYGPVFNVAAPAPVMEGYSLFLIFAAAHALTYLTGGLILKDARNCLNLMAVSLIVTLLTNATLLLPYTILWLPAMAIFGVFSSLYIMGWCCLYSLFIPNVGRLKLMAAVIIWGNVIFVIFNLLASFLPAQAVLALALLPLVGAGVILSRFKFPYLQKSKPLVKAMPLLKPLLVIICLFIFVLYLNGGLMYRIIMPTLDLQVPFAFYFRYVIYILIVLVMYIFGERLQRYFPIYMAVSLLGMAYISFALLSDLTAGFFLTASMFEAAFAMLDLFIWVTLGSLAFLYKAPFQFFGLALAANLSGIILGDFFGELLLESGESIRLMTAIFASLSIFAVFIIVPWLNQQVEKNLPQALEGSTISPLLSGSGQPAHLEAHLIPGEKLTPREIEIIALILKGYTNKDIAEKLFVSPNTIKTHLKNIYYKFGVNKKKDLIILSSKGHLID